jgi:methionine-rich copper-binding protein CopC
MKQFITVPVRSYGQRSLAALGLAFLTLALLVAAARAHSLLIKSEPEDNAVLEQAPEQVVAWFSQELETRLSSMQVFDPEGNQVDSGDGSVDLNDPDHASMLVSLPESLPNGTYLIRWTAVSSEDGDTSEGEFSFSVTNSGAPAGQALEASRSPADNGPDLPVGELIIAFGVLLLIGIGLILYPRLARGS